MHSDKSVNLLEEVLTTVKTIGLQQTLEANINARQNESSLKFFSDIARKEKIVCNEICTLFSLTIEQLKKRHFRHDNKQPAMMIICAYFIKEMKYRPSTIAPIFDVHTSYISHKIKAFNYLSKEIPEEKDLLEKFEKSKKILKKKLAL